MSRWRNLRCEAGYALLEAVVGAAVLAVIALGTLPLLDALASQSGRTRDRGVETQLAQSDLERMRAMDVRDLAHHHRTTPVKVGRLNYLVTSDAEWMRDAGGVVSCTADPQAVDYLRIRSTVRPAGTNKHHDPTVMESLVSPPVGGFGVNSGTLAVSVLDGDSAPVAGLDISAGNQTVPTTDAGCAVLGGLKSGSQQVTFSRPGYVLPTGEEQVALTANVLAGATSTVSYQYDRAGSAPVAFDTVPSSGLPAVAAASRTVSLSHTTLTGDRAFTAAAPAAQLTGTSLFPFRSSYAAYGGACPGNDPTTYDADYFDSRPGLTTVPPGGTAPAVTVRMPSVWVRVLRGGSPYPGARLTFRTRLAACTETFDVQASGAGGDAKVALPFGPYTVCASDAAGRRATATISNVQPDGMAAPVSLTIPTSGTAQGACPA